MYPWGIRNIIMATDASESGRHRASVAIMVFHVQCTCSISLENFSIDNLQCSFFLLEI